MKHFLTLFFLFSLTTLSAQSKWSVGLVGGFDFAKTTKEPPYSYAGGDKVPYLRQYIVAPRYGVNLEYKLGNLISLKYGFRYNVQGLRFSEEQRSSNADDWGQVFRSRYIELPLHIKVSILGDKWNYFIEGGASPNLYLGTKWGVDYFNNDDYVYYDNYVFPRNNRITVSLDIGFGLERSISEKVNLSVQIMGRYYPLSEEEPWDLNYYNFGIEVGASYALGR